MSARIRSQSAVVRGLAALAVAVFVVPTQAAAQTGTDEVTFTKDIAPILQRSCQKCHRPGSVAPMSLITYQDVRPWARSIRNRTALRDQPGVMPPWYIERNIGIQQFKDDPSLSEEEIAKIAHWVENGAPEGDLADMPPPRTFIDVDEWEIGEPDLIVTSDPIEVPALAPDWWGNIGAIPLGLTEDRYVRDGIPGAQHLQKCADARHGRRAVRHPSRHSDHRRRRRPAGGKLAGARGGPQRRLLRGRCRPVNQGRVDAGVPVPARALERR